MRDDQRLGLSARLVMRPGVAEQADDSIAKLRRILRVEDPRDRCRPDT